MKIVEGVNWKLNDKVKQILNFKALTTWIAFRDPTGVVSMSTLKQVQALHIVVKKQPLRNRLVSTTAADLDVVDFDFFVPSFMLEITHSNGKLYLH